jgi:hypothetical protein
VNYEWERLWKEPAVHIFGIVSRFRPATPRSVCKTWHTLRLQVKQLGASQFSAWFCLLPACWRCTPSLARLCNRLFASLPYVVRFSQVSGICRCPVSLDGECTVFSVIIRFLRLQNYHFITHVCFRITLCIIWHIAWLSLTIQYPLSEYSRHFFFLHNRSSLPYKATGNAVTLFPFFPIPYCRSLLQMSPTVYVTAGFIRNITSWAI